MAELFVYLLAAWGLSWVVAFSEAGALIRGPASFVPILRDLVQCPACLGFWIGVALAAGGMVPESLEAVFAHRIATIVAAGFATAGFCRILAGNVGQESD